NPQPNPFGISVPYTFISNLDAADLDNDGDIDIVVNGYYGDFTYFENTGTPEAPAFTNAGDLDLTLGFAYLRSTEFVDFDDDGDLDLLQHDYSFYFYGSGVVYTENIGDPENPIFDTPQTDPAGIFGLYVYAGNYSSIAAGDMDSDGDIDVWVGTDFDGLLYFENTSAINAAPLSEDTFIEVDENDSYLFATSDFPIIDPEGDELVEVQITALPSVGMLTFKSLSVNLNQIIPVANLGGIAYTPLPDEFGTNYDSFQFKVSDGFNFSNDSYTMTVNVLEGQNATPSSEDITIAMQESTAYSFETADFPYSDPDGDAFSALRISSLPGAGLLTLSGVPVISAQEIPAAEIEDLLFTPVAGETGQPYTSFTFQVGDGENFSAGINTVTVNVGDNVSTQSALELAHWDLSPNPARSFVQ
ncbi:MAG: Ig-like domain-containing protein, partial [Bacteroidota bacterium]